eukprot:2966179-Heterocapsa_arctica.AAC.1
MLSERKLPPEREKYHLCAPSPWKQPGNARRNLWATFETLCWVCEPWILGHYPENFQQTLTWGNILNQYCSRPQNLKHRSFFGTALRNKPGNPMAPNTLPRGNVLYDYRH